MKKILIILILPVILLLTGCEDDNRNVQSEEFTFGEFYTYCDSEYGVEYIQYIDGPYRGGITVRLDENGDVIRCEGKENQDGNSN